MRCVFGDWDGGFWGCGGRGRGFGAREVDCSVAGAAEDVGAAEGGEGDRVDGGGVGGEG